MLRANKVRLAARYPRAGMSCLNFKVKLTFEWLLMDACILFCDWYGKVTLYIYIYIYIYIYMSQRAAKK
jgi:hypothetical protein